MDGNISQRDMLRQTLGGAATAPLAFVQERKNVLFLVVNMRTELDCCGNRIVKTPNMDRLARRGLVFTRAYCQQAVSTRGRLSSLA
jgi:iduronate 2-sulfatase